MRKILSAFTFLLAVLSFAGCAAPDSARAPQAFEPGSIPAAGMRPHAVEHFYFVNDDSSLTMHVYNTRASQCLQNELPSVRIEPHKSWSGILYTKDTGWPCGIIPSVTQLVFWFGGATADNNNYVELQYRYGGGDWKIFKEGGRGGYGNGKETFKSPLKTHCQQNKHNIIVCSIGNT